MRKSTALIISGIGNNKHKSAHPYFSYILSTEKKKINRGRINRNLDGKSKLRDGGFYFRGRKMLARN